MTTEAFEWYIREELVPQLRPGQVVVLDNLSAHKAASIRRAMESRSCDLLFLPPYSPDCTPIEQAFSKLKAILRGRGARPPRGPPGSRVSRHRGDYPQRRRSLVRPCGLPSICSRHLKVALVVL